LEKQRTQFALQFLVGDTLAASFAEYCTEEGPDRDSLQIAVCDGLCIAVGNVDENITQLRYRQRGKTLLTTLI